MVKISKKEIDWLKREKYNNKMCEVASGSARNDFSHFAKDLARLEAGEPIDYVIGWKEFLGCKIDLSKKPLIPREETEFWVGKAIYQLGGLTSKFKVLDLFAGSGCIGLAIKKHIPKAQVTFGDLHPINKNIIKTNIFSNISGKFDYIFANPPYVPTKKSGSASLTASCVQESVKNWEPKEALYAGEDGLLIIRKFLEQAKNYLRPEGPSASLRTSKIYLEFGFGQKLAITKLLKQFGYKNWQFHKDQFGKYRWVIINTYFFCFLINWFIILTWKMKVLI